MSGITRATALEIFSQPNDLYFEVPQPSENGKYAITISRGPEHRFKVLLTTEAVIDSRDEAINGIRQTLEEICKLCREELENPSSLPAQMLNPQRLPINESCILTQERIEDIVKQLQAGGKAETYIT